MLPQDDAEFHEAEDGEDHHEHDEHEEHEEHEAHGVGGYRFDTAEHKEQLKEQRVRFVRACMQAGVPRPLRIATTNHTASASTGDISIRPPSPHTPCPPARATPLCSRAGPAVDMAEERGLASQRC